MRLLKWQVWSSAALLMIVLQQAGCGVERTDRVSPDENPPVVNPPKSGDQTDTKPPATPADPAKDPKGPATPVVTPKIPQTFYNTFLSDCTDVGGGLNNQVYVRPTVDGNLAVGVLTWARNDCKGTFALTDTQGNPVDVPSSLGTFAQVDLKDIPAEFFVIKLTSAGELSFAVLHLAGDRLDVLSDFTSGYPDWKSWLKEAEVSGFAANPTGYVSSSKTVTHAHQASGLPNPAEFLYNSWLSDCLDFGGGSINQIFVTLNSKESRIASLTWSASDCLGTYALSDSSGNPVSGPVVEQENTMTHVSGTPDHVYVIKSVQLATPSQPAYVVMYRGVNEFYELISFDTFHANWDDWLLESEVAGFVADPVNYVATGRMKMHFQVSTLP